MTTTYYNPATTHGSLVKSPIRAVLAGAFGLAVMALGAGTAQADDYGDIACPSGAKAGQYSVVKLMWWKEGTNLAIVLSPGADGSPNQTLSDIAVSGSEAASTTKYWTVPIPPLTAGHYTIGVSAAPPGQSVDPRNPVRRCDFDVSA
jgi:hypothetical protein